MHKPESFPVNETHKILWDFELQTDHLTPTKRPNLVTKKKKFVTTFCVVDFAVSVGNRMKKRSCGT